MSTSNSSALPGPGSAHARMATTIHIVSLLRFLAPIVAMLLVWEFCVRTGLANAAILPSPSMILVRGAELLGFSHADHSPLISHILYSLVRAMSAFILGCMVAIPLGFLLGLNAFAYRWVSPIISLMLPLPALAWTPIFLVIMGQSEATIIWVCFLGAVFPILYATIQGVRSITKQSLWVVRSMGARRRDIFFKVLLPGSLPALMAGLKLGMAHSWRTLVAAEMMAALSSGVGFMIFSARTYMDVSTMFVGIVVLAVIGMTIEHGLFGPLEKMTVRRWHNTGRVGGSR